VLADGSRRDAEQVRQLSDGQGRDVYGAAVAGALARLGLSSTGTLALAGRGIPSGQPVLSAACLVRALGHEHRYLAAACLSADRRKRTAAQDLGPVRPRE